ncbi:MAG TPA: hypothetical protein VL022_09115 [Moheibacter sp.]|nr:hypothetical protein [Moheibacter sp.]
MQWDGKVVKTSVPVQKPGEKSDQVISEKPAEAVVEKPTEIPQKEAAPKMMRAEKPVKAKVSRSFDLSKLFDKVEEEKVVLEDLSGKPKDAFTLDQLKQHWEAFLQILQSENQIPSFNALQSGKIGLKPGFVIHFEFNSGSLEAEFNSQRTRLMHFFREQLNNYAIDFQVEIKEDKEVKFIITKADVFQQLAEKNPLLLKMKQEFGLDYNSED